MFGPSLLCPNGWMYQDASWYRGRPPPKRHCVWCGPSSLPKRGQSPPPFLAYVCCGQTSGWIKMPPGTKVGFFPCHIVLNGDPAPPPERKGHSNPHVFGPCLLWLRSPISAELLYLNVTHLIAACSICVHHYQTYSSHVN